MKKSPKKLAGRYTLIEKIGQGGFAEVWRGYDLQLQREVAIKSVKGEAQQLVGRRLVDESRRLHRLSHPNIVQLYDVIEERNCSAIVLELCRSNLADYVYTYGPLPVYMVAEIGVAILAGLSEAHTKQIVHRDIKPENLLVGIDGTVKLADFGISTFLDVYDSRTRSNTILGTIPYMPPEQRQAKSTSPQTDFYALAVTLVWLATGSLYSDLYVPSVQQQLAGQLPESLLSVLFRAAAYVPEERYSSADEMGRDLEAVLSNLDVARVNLSLMTQRRLLIDTAIPSKRSERRASKTGVFAVIGFLFLLGMFGVWREVVYRKSSEETALLISREQEKVKQLEEEQSNAQINTELEALTEQLEKDPRVVVHRLQELAKLPNFTQWPKLRILLSEAQRYGISRALVGHTKRINSLAISPDGEYLVSAGEDRDIRLWKLSTGEVVVLRGHSDLVSSLSFSTDGKFVISASHDKTLRYWDLQTYQEIFREDVGFPISFVERMAEGRWLILCNFNKIKIFDIVERRQIKGFNLLEKEIRSGIGGQSGKLLVTNTKNEIQLWSVESQDNFVLRHTISFSDTVNVLTLSPLENLLGVGFSSGKFCIYSVSDAKFLWTSQVSQRSVSNLQFAPNGSYLVASSDDGMLTFLTPEGKQTQSLRVGSAELEKLVISPDSRYILVSSRDRHAYLYDTTTKQLSTLHGLSGSVLAIAYHKDWVAAGDVSGNLRVWSLRELFSREQIVTPSFPAGEKEPRGLAARENLLAYTTKEGHVYVVDRSNKSTRLLAEHLGEVVFMAFSHNLQWLAVATAERRIFVIALASGTTTELVDKWEVNKNTTLVYDLKFSADDKLLFSAGQDSQARMWSLAQMRCIQHFVGHRDTVHTLAVSPDNQLLISSSNDFTLRFWEVSTGTELTEKQQTGRYTQLSFSNDGSLFVAAYYKGILWVAKTNTPEQNLIKKDLTVGSIFAIDVSQDNLSIALGGSSGVRLLDLETMSLQTILSNEMIEQVLVFNHKSLALETIDSQGRLRSLGKELPRNKEALLPILNSYP